MIALSGTAAEASEESKTAYIYILALHISWFKLSDCTYPNTHVYTGVIWALGVCQSGVSTMTVLGGQQG